MLGHDTVVSISHIYFRYVYGTGLASGAQCGAQASGAPPRHHNGEGVPGEEEMLIRAAG
jgi:hypothetical protein